MIFDINSPCLGEGSLGYVSRCKVDDPNFKEKLWGIEPEAIGGDMEGAGVVSACHRRSVPWVVVKGICDWGENKGDNKEKLAARHAIGFVFDMLAKVNVGQ